MPRVILLGASNLTLAFPRLWHGLQTAWPEPLHLYAAHGHGRSFGMWSRVGPRELPGIVSCGLWNELQSVSGVNEPPKALLTDIGNDLLYGAEPQQVAAWVETCVRRLKDFDAHVVMTQLPLASVLSLSRSRFQFFHRVLFPGSRLRFEEVEPLAMLLNQLIVELGRRLDVTVRELPGEWYGFDPIHIRRRERAAAWQSLLSPWFETQDHSVTLPSPGVASSVRLWQKRPHERRWFGRHEITTQFVHEESDGSKLWLY